MEILIGAIGLVLLFFLGMYIGNKLDEDLNPFIKLFCALLLLVSIGMACFGMMNAGRSDAEYDFLNGKYELRYETRVINNDSIVKIDSTYVLK